MTFGPFTRSSWVRSVGTSFTVTPGTGTPMQPGPSSGKWAVVAMGAVSVDPHDAVNGMGRSTERRASAPSRSHEAWGNAAPRTG